MLNSSKRALICGIGGQDGAYLARLLLSKGYQVTGTSRDTMAASLSNLTALGIRDQVGMVSMTIGDLGSVLSTIKRTEPDEIYNLAAQSSVGMSFQEPVETMQSIAIGTLHLLEAIRFVDRPIRLYSAGSSECFGDAGTVPATEETPFSPQSPYAIAKVAAHHFVANYRDAYKLYACTGILFNHESPLRPDRYVTKKIISAACRIANGSTDKLHLGNIGISRDWGIAEDYVDAMWRMLQQPLPEDYVIATGATNTLQSFVACVFDEVNLDWCDHVVLDPNLFRPSEIMSSRANPIKAFEKLGWKAKFNMREMIKLCVQAELAFYEKLR
jgi:GDPmannose 4,6-dehydratase